VPDADFQAASAVFSEKELADLTIAIGLMNAYNRLAIGFRVPPKAALSEQQDDVGPARRATTYLPGLAKINQDYSWNRARLECPKSDLASAAAVPINPDGAF
jgi:hypothetical protein